MRSFMHAVAATTVLMWSLPLLFAAEGTNEKPPHALELRAAYLHLQKGRVDEAIEAYEKLAKAKADPAAVAIGLSRAYEAQGKLSEATTVVQKAVDADGKNAALLARLAEIRFLQGEYDEAGRHAAAALEIDADEPLAHVVQAETWTETGQIDQADEAYRWFVRYYNRVQPEDAPTLLLVARGAVQYARWHGVSQIFNFAVNTLCPDALKSDESSWQSYSTSGSLLLEKYNRAQALPEFQKALAINPRAAEVLVALGNAALQQHDLEEAGRFAEQALKVNPRLLGALWLKTDVILNDGSTRGALEVLAEAQQVNPQEQRTLARLAACYLLQDGPPDEEHLASLLANLDAIQNAAIASPTRFEQLLIDLARRNPKPGPFLSTLGETLEAHRRFKLAERLYKQAIAVMPQLSEPKTNLGMLYMRIGKTVEAETILNNAFEADPYHVRVSNMRKVLKVLDGYETIATEHFVIRVDSQADKILGRYMAEYLEEQYDGLVKHYGFEPPNRTQFEIYHNAKGLSAHQWFSARMIGLPWIQTIGASTGMIVALASPTASEEKFNWARVLKHEFVHIITLQQTNFNIPHWFTEALAVTAEGTPRPAVWNQLLLERVPKKQLRSLDELSQGFIRPESPLDWQFAYCQSRLYAQFMIEKYGDETISKMLDAYRRNVSTEKAIPEVFGVDVETFEKGYHDFLNEIVSQLTGGAPAVEEQSLADLEMAYLADKDNPRAMAGYAHGLLQVQERRKARELALAALAKNKAEPLAAIVMANLELLSQDLDSAADYLDPALDREKPHPEVLALLAKVRFAQAKYEDAAHLYALGRQHFPYDADWPKGLAAVYLKSGKSEGLADVLKLLAGMDPDDAVVRKKLAQMALEAKNYEDVVKYGTETLHIDVLDVETHRMLGEAHAALKNHAKAVREYEVAVELDPDHAETKTRLQSLRDK